MIKLLLLDIDGVLTDGKKTYNRDGEVISKTFCDKDWTAIKRFQSIGIKVIFMTGDGYNASIISNRNLPLIVCRKDGVHTDKSQYMDQICEENDCTTDDVCVVGDDLFDLKLMMMVIHRFCLLDSPAVLKKYCDVLGCKGGENAIMHLFDVLEAREIIPTHDCFTILDKIYELDTKEKF
jgi:3-deoxy-D-manno-octulosonate 8-phosphate phosphatase (KDO 8-P phosphatase)